MRPAGASLVAESPSPLPPPRSRARAISSNDDASSAAAAAAAAAEASAAGAAMAVTLAGSLFGVVVLLASEWVEVGSGLAEISMRADTWGNRLLASLIEVRGALKRGKRGRGAGAAKAGPAREGEDVVRSWRRVYRRPAEDKLLPNIVLEIVCPYRSHDHVPCSRIVVLSRVQPPDRIATTGRSHRQPPCRLTTFVLS